jgi:hypothetical protein
LRSNLLGNVVAATVTAAEWKHGAFCRRDGGSYNEKIQKPLYNASGYKEVMTEVFITYA